MKITHDRIDLDSDPTIGFALDIRFKSRRICVTIGFGLALHDFILEPKNA